MKYIPTLMFTTLSRIAEDQHQYIKNGFYATNPIMIISEEQYAEMIDYDLVQEINIEWATVLATGEILTPIMT